jgi:hypothetical protein
LAIPENQLEVWANPASQAKFIDAHESIRNVLEKYNWPSGKPTYDVYLQGSYKNSTTTRKNSDVDLVVQLNSSFKQDLSKLSEYEKTLFLNDHHDADYLWENFRYDILNALRQNYSEVEIGKNSIKVETPYVGADVVVCVQYRLYHSYRSSQSTYYVEGMTFKSLDNRWIVNYPRLHAESGEKKSGKTNGWYKKTVRMFKNTKLYLVDHGIISKDLASSYFVECLLCNVPDSNFGTNYQNTFYNVLNYLISAEIGAFKCQNGITDLFGNSPEQWSTRDAKDFINKTVNLWNNWGK